MADEIRKDPGGQSQRAPRRQACLFYLRPGKTTLTPLCEPPPSQIRLVCSWSAFSKELHRPPNEAKRIMSDTVVVLINSIFLKSEAIIELYQFSSF